MYTGKLFETGSTGAIFDEPRHPYTKGLLGAISRLGAGRDAPLEGIAGAVPDLMQLPSGCTFHPRCALADRACAEEFPPTRVIADGRECACHKVVVP